MNRNCILSLLLCAILCLSAVSCGNTAEDTSPHTETSPQETETVMESETEITPDLEVKDYGGRTFRFAYHDPPGVEEVLWAEEDSGDVEISSIYNRNLRMEEQWNIHLEFLDTGLNGNDHATDLVQNVMSGTEAYEMTYGNGMYLVQHLSEHPYTNYYDIPHLGFDRPWWNTQAMDDLTMLGKLYIFTPMTSSLAVSDVQTIVLNKGLLADYQLEMPYEDVKSGTWTIDKLIAMTKDVYQDLNGMASRTRTICTDLHATPKERGGETLLPSTISPMKAD